MKSNSSSIEGLDHHSLLSLIAHKQASTLKYSLQGLDYLLETTSCAMFLREAGNAEMRSLSVLNNGHDFASEGNFFHLQIYRSSDTIGRSQGGC